MYFRAIVRALKAVEFTETATIGHNGYRAIVLERYPLQSTAQAAIQKSWRADESTHCYWATKPVVPPEGQP